MSIYSKIIDIQKLNEAWQRVRKNKPAAGVDNVSTDDFDLISKEEIKQLNIELAEHEYRVMPVKMVTLLQGEKLREVSLYCMRDKVVQTSLATELGKIYEKTFSSQAYAYRSDRSALVAAEDIEKAVLSGRYLYVCKTDITKFFDNISLEQLYGILREKVREVDVLELIMSQLKAQSITKDGTLIEKTKGIYQGSSISPLLSNIYLEDVDQLMTERSPFYARYADDILIMAETKEKIEQVFAILKGLLERKELEINEGKTVLKTVAEGFEFLGYAFDTEGRRATDKAEQHLTSNLEGVWLTMRGASLEERLKKGSQILNGWEQYYRDDRQIKTIYEYVVMVYMLRYKEELKAMMDIRYRFINNFKDITRYLVEVWKERECNELVIYEYEQYFEVAQEYVPIKKGIFQEEIVSLYEILLKEPSEDSFSALLQAYSDIKQYDKAERIVDKLNHLAEQKGQEKVLPPEGCEIPLKVDAVFLNAFSDIFVGREDMYVREILQDGKRKSEFVPEPLTPDVLKKHFSGQETIGTYILRNNDTVHFIVFDVDISKKVLLNNPDENQMEEYLMEAGRYTAYLLDLLNGMGLKAYAEFSGYRGYHIWLFCSEWIPSRFAQSLIEIVLNKAEKPQDIISLEAFPGKSRKKTGSNGQTIKLPYALHLYSGRRSFLCDRQMQQIGSVTEYLNTIARYSTENIKKVIAAHISETVDKGSQATCKIELEWDKLQNIGNSVTEVLKGCTLMQYLVNKAMKTGYLTHFERLSVLNVFGHLGEEGKEFVHTVMSFTLNYKHHVTERFVQKIPEKPISCIKLRDQYKQITAEYGCSCAFKRTKDCYPSPVIHALRKNTEENHEITIPTSRSISAAKRSEVYDELNVHVKAQELARSIVELRKQKRGIDKSIAKIEKELMILYDNAGVDCMETDWGLLVRRPKEGGVEWVIEL